MEPSSTHSIYAFGIEKCSDSLNGIHQLSENPNHLNHLGLNGASAVFALAEASSDTFLKQNLKNLELADYILSLRSADIKFRAPSSGKIYSHGKLSERDWKSFHQALNKNNRALIQFPIQIMNESGKCVAIAHFEWFVFKKPQRQKGN